MPAQRTTRHASRQPSHIKALSSSPTPGPDPEVIVISSDEDTPLSRKSSVQPRHRRTQAKGKGRLPPPPHDIIEISSDEEGGPPRRMPTPSRSPVASRRRQPQNTRAEPRRPSSSTHRRATSELSATEPSVCILAQSQVPISMLEDRIGCEICLLPMWTPYALSCGHTFCQSCLQEWFSTILAHHMHATPGYNHVRIAELNAQLREPELHIQMRHGIIALLSSIEAETPSPTYSCPFCRDTVTSRPSEVFALKNVVHAIATANGESPPKKPLPPNAAPSGVGGLWDGFFPRTTY
ncbi:hypothetical protein WOLCODRAFT_29436 [Wolfiporia cocos MD-104 SS10]|uniref:RING-type domain-containing protein n=1 Tax=Wolfiporia cocos (strain MD-104) TaxID=742152 RepID=A0A2H3JBE5_WOLCO|nr:hypothetical protein WOLCODRAFT_29436 [Wolfiporia cocos MD-104 SS10]